MEDNDNIVIEVNKTDIRHQLGKLVLVTVAGFAAQKIAENVFDKLVDKRQKNHTAEPQQ